MVGVEIGIGMLVLIEVEVELCIGVAAGVEGPLPRGKGMHTLNCSCHLCC